MKDIEIEYPAVSIPIVLSLIDDEDTMRLIRDYEDKREKYAEALRACYDQDDKLEIYGDDEEREKLTLARAKVEHIRDELDNLTEKLRDLAVIM